MGRRIQQKQNLPVKKVPSDSQIDIAVAEARGWTRFCTHVVCGRVVHYGFPPNSRDRYETPLPKVSTDFNDVRDAVLELSAKDRIEFASILDVVVNKVSTKDVYTVHSDTLFSSPRQWSESFLRLRKKWRWV